MAYPVITDVQLVPPGGTGKLEIEQPVDPSGDPVTVLDIDLGFTFKGYVELPGWLSGNGVVRLSADEIGGPFDDTIGEDNLAIIGATDPNDPPNIKYYWSITVTTPALPDETKLYQFGIAFLLKTQAGGHTDIGGFYDLGAFLVV